MNFGEKNVGLVDRVIRIVLGFFVIGFGAKYISLPWNLIVALVGFVIVATGVIASSFIYSKLGMSTAPAKPAAKASKRKAKNA